MRDTRIWGALALFAAFALVLTLLFNAGTAGTTVAQQQQPTATPTPPPTYTPEPTSTPTPPPALAAPTLSVTRAGLASWSFTVPSGASFQQTTLKWGETGSTQKVFNDVNTLSYQLTGLAESTQYKVKVTVTVTRNGDEESASTQVTFTTNGVPEAPGSVTVSRHQENADATAHLDISWTEPNDGGSAISGYDIETSTDSKSTWTRIATNTLNQSNSYHVNNITPHLEYYVRVRAVNSKGQSAWAVAGPLSIHSAPLAPIEPEATLADCDSDDGLVCRVSFTWKAPTSGSAPEKYDVKIAQTNGQGDPIQVNDLPSTTTSHSFRLSSYGHYEAKVRSKNHVGTSDWSDGALVTASDPPAAISTITASRGDKTLILSWKVPWNGGSSILSYQAQCRTTDTTTWSDCASNITASGDEGSDFSTTIMNMVNNKAYVVRVRVQNVVAYSAWTQSGTIAKAGPPTQVGTISATREAGTIIVSWGAAANATAYDLRLKESNGTIWLQTKNDISGTAATFSNVTDSKAYIVSIRPENVFGNGTWLDSGIIYARSSSSQ